MNQQQADKIGHLKRENKALAAKLQNYEALQQTCIEQQHELNKLRSKMKRMLEIGRE